MTSEWDSVFSLYTVIVLLAVLFVIGAVLYTGFTLAFRIAGQ